MYICIHASTRRENNNYHSQNHKSMGISGVLKRQLNLIDEDDDDDDEGIDQVEQAGRGECSELQIHMFELAIKNICTYVSTYVL